MEKTQHTAFWRSVGSIHLAVEHWIELDSTNDRARTLCAELDCPVLVTADHQRRGRGRHGRTWQDEPGSAVLMTLALPSSWSEAAFPSVALMAAAALGVLGELLRYAQPEALRLKYPNDIWAKPPDRPSGKLAGMLIEADYTGTARGVCAVGIGINLRSVPTIADAPYPVRCLADVAAGVLPEPTELAERIAERVLDMLVHEPTAAIVARWQENLSLPGRTVLLRNSGSAVRIVGFTDDGGLRVTDVESGTSRVITDGESVHYDPFAL